MDFKNQKAAVIGLGIEGKDTLKFLLGEGARVTVFDKKEKDELDTSEVSSLGFDFVGGPNYLDKLKDFDVIVRSPGVRPDLPELVAAVKNGANLTSAINIFFELCPCPIIGVTGTKGKGTTATLVYECLVASGKSAYIAGNIGIPYLELLPRLTRSGLVVLELSSFQLLDAVKSPHIAVVLNVTTDHLDWHPDREEYVSAKTNILRMQNKNDFAVLSCDYDEVRQMWKLTKGKVYYFAGKEVSSSEYFAKAEEVEGAYILDGLISLNMDGVKEELGKVADLLLRGEHNWENAAAAVVAAKLAGGTLEGIKKAVFSFKGLPHRLELTGEVDGVAFYNDSFATSPLPALAAVRAFQEPVVLILGGSRKGFSYEDFGRELSSEKNLKAVVVIGETGPEIKEALEKGGFRGDVAEGAGNMEQIVKTAYNLAKKGDVVLLSPAAASFDMFHDYKDRGNQFKAAVGILKNENE